MSTVILSSQQQIIDLGYAHRTSPPSVSLRHLAMDKTPLCSSEMASAIFDPNATLDMGFSKKERTTIHELRTIYQAACVQRSHGLEASSPESLSSALMPRVVGRSTECFLVVPLSSRCRIIDVVELTRGDAESVDAPVQEILRCVLKTRGATSFAVAHNHPTGDPSPSAADKAVTKRLFEAGRLMGTSLRDHLVLAPPYFVSLRRDAPDNFR